MLTLAWAASRAKHVMHAYPFALEKLDDAAFRLQVIKDARLSRQCRDDPRPLLVLVITRE
jgi:hypothetical protein